MLCCVTALLKLADIHIHIHLCKHAELLVYVGWLFVFKPLLKFGPVV